jgi:O-antigen/teichoic acid export membrane protein
MHYSLTRATAWNVSGYLYLIIASLISVPILVKGLGVAIFSQYSLILATLSLVSSFNLGLPQAVVRALSHHHLDFPKRQTIWATSSLLFILTGLIGAVIATVAAYYLHVSYAVLPIVFGLGIMHNLVAHYLTLPHAEGHFGYFNVKTFIVGTHFSLLIWPG